MTDPNKTPATSYGNAGLVPFVVCAALVWILPNHLALPAGQVFACYSTVILSFLGGIVWGTALQTDTQTPARDALLKVAIAVSLLSWVCLIIAMIPAQTGSFGLAIAIAINGLAFVLLRQFERARCDPHYPDWFIQLRDWLTRIVFASHISVAVFALQFPGG